MQNPFKKENDLLDQTLASAYKELESLTADDPVYAKTVKQIVKLESIRAERRPKGISRDTLVQVGGTIVVASIIVAAEQYGHIFRSEAAKILTRMK